MGFPVGYSVLPELLLRAILLLGDICRLISWAFASLGLSVVQDSDALWLESPSEISPQLPELLIDELLLTVRYESLNCCPRESCAVCLQEIKGPEEVRKLRNCRHIFHRHCLDRWMGHAQRTCPLCRAPLFPKVEGGGPYDWFLDYDDERVPSPATTIAG